MCTTAAMFAITALQGIQQYNATKQQASAQAAMNNAQAKVADYNAKLSETRQSQIADQYASQQRKLDDRMRLASGQAAAQAGSSNLQLSGSPLDVLGSSYQAWHDDSNQLVQNQRNDIWDEYLNQANYQNQASSYRSAAANAEEQGNTAAWGTLLGTAASLYGINRMYGKAYGTQTRTPGINPIASSAGSYGAYSKDWGFPDQIGVFTSQTGKYSPNLTLPWSTTIGAAASQDTPAYSRIWNYSPAVGLFGTAQKNPYANGWNVNYTWNKKIGG